MIYTIGHKQNYLNAFRKGTAVFKLGKRPGYTGGYAFESVEDAQKRIDEAYRDRGYSIFGLYTDWNNTEKALDGWWSYLIEDAQMAIIDISGKEARIDNALGLEPRC